jgi:hypothetical protein
MKFNEARAILRTMGFTISSRDGEYRVCHKTWTEEQSYYTNDLEDAVGTARAQHARMYKVVRREFPDGLKQDRKPGTMDWVALVAWCEADKERTSFALAYTVIGAMKQLTKSGKPAPRTSKNVAFTEFLWDKIDERADDFIE